jgi:hypothetical protein
MGQLFNSRECDALPRPCCMWSVAGDGLSASAQCVAQCRAQAMASRSGWLRQSAVRCVADRLLATRQAPACSSGVMLMFGIKHPFWIVTNNLTPFGGRRQITLPWCSGDQLITPWCVRAGCFFPIYWSWLFLLDASSELERWLISAKPSQSVNWGRRLAQVDVPLSVSHSCVWPHRWAL